MTDSAGGHPDCAARLKQDNARLRERLAATQHRVRNTLAVIRSIARRSAETSETVEDYAMHLDGRIGAFARVQGALLRDPDEGMALDTLVADILLSVLAQEGGRLSIGGPAVTLRAKTAELLGLALHELATNAVKFGSLSTREGRVAVSWTVTEDDGAVVLHWTEAGGPSEPVSSRRGFGTEFLQQTLAYELAAEILIRFSDQGLECRICLPHGAILLSGIR